MTGGRQTERADAWARWIRGLPGDVREQMGCAGCALGVIAAVVAGSGTTAAVIDAWRYGWEAGMLWGIAVSLVPAALFGVSWRHPSLTQIMLVIVLAVAAGIFIMFAIFAGLFGSSM
jgi:hypothetical protein